MAKLKTGRHTSAIKSARQAERRHWSNVARTEIARSLTKRLQAAIAKKDVAEAKQLLPQVASVWQRLGQRHKIHPATAARRIGRLSRAVHRLSSSPAS
jgi:small subunit ribosomal protein S20